MAKIVVSLPDSLMLFVDQQVASGRYRRPDEYIRELIRREHDRLRIRTLLLAGAASPVGPSANARYFAALRAKSRTTGRTSHRR